MAATLTSALLAAISDASRPLSRDLRRTATKSGWGTKETRGMKVAVSGHRMSVTAPEAALGREYGGAGRAPPIGDGPGHLTGKGTRGSERGPSGLRGHADRGGNFTFLTGATGPMVRTNICKKHGQHWQQVARRPFQLSPSRSPNRNDG